MSPAAAVRGPKHSVTIGKTPVLYKPEWRKLFDSMPTETVRDLSDRALIGLAPCCRLKEPASLASRGRGFMR
jgi:hypothetical protein